MKVRVIHRPDGGVSVIHPAPKSRKRSESEATWLDRVFTRAMQEFPGAEYEDIDKSQLPQSRKDRDAWEGVKGHSIVVNPVKAQQIRNDRKMEEKIQEKLRKMAIKELEKE